MKLRLILLSLLTAFSLQAQPLGYLGKDLDAKEAYCGPSSYMDFYHGLALSQKEVEISLSGMLSIDGCYSSGPIYEKDISRLYPFPNDLLVVQMSGEEIQRYLEASYQAWAGPEGLLLKSSGKADGSVKWNFRHSPSNFDSAAGVDYTVDLSKPAGERVHILALADGRAFDAHAIYKVAITSYRAGGAGKLLQAAGIDPKQLDSRLVGQRKPFRDILRECLAASDTLYPARMSRGSWRFVPAATVDSLGRSWARVFGLPREGRHDTHAQVMADIERAGAMHYMYPTDQPVPTAAPKGYKPFYISHLGRHGARYALGETVYGDLLEIWTKGHGKHWLTEEGEAIYKAYKELYPAVAHREGQLSRKGQEQQRLIARQMVRNYPDVFKGRTQAAAVSTNVHRVIASMYSFLGEMEKLDKDFSYDADYGFPYQETLLPKAAGDVKRPAGVQRKYERFMDDRLDLEGMLARWFTQPDSLVSSPYKFCYDMHTVISTLDNIDSPAPAKLYSVFTPEERYRLWDVFNYNGYLRFGMSPDVDPVWPKTMKCLWKEILEDVEADWNNHVQLHLRFAHDLSLLPLMSLIDINGMGARIKDPYKVAEYWRSFDIPMACNIQLVFHRKQKDLSEILVQVLLNGYEATLPLPMAAPGCFYRWEDLRTLCQ